VNFDLIADIALSNIDKPYAKIVLIELAKYSNSQGECFPSRDTLALGSLIPLRSVARSLKWLEINGHIRIDQRKGTSNFYVITCMEDEMTDDTRAKLAHEVVSNITILDTNKVSITSRAKLAHPLDTEMFWAFWSTYPRRIGKGSARTAFAKATKFEDPNVIIQAALDYSTHCEVMGTERQFIPHPATWLNGERWEDELETEMPQKKLGGFLDEL
jgi:DNA-binding transcriptional regulator YhcF (GntR family)